MAGFGFLQMLLKTQGLSCFLEMLLKTHRVKLVFGAPTCPKEPPIYGKIGTCRWESGSRGSIQDALPKMPIRS